MSKPVSQELSSLEPIGGARRALRKRLTIKGELILALLPTLTVLAVFAMVDVLSQQRLLFASLASSAFLIYLDPQHGTNRIRTLILAQVTAAVIGLLTYLVLGTGYVSGGTAMVLTIGLMIALDAVHPPAVSTALSFALRAGNVANVLLFAVAVGITAGLVILELATLWLLTRLSRT